MRYDETWDRPHPSAHHDAWQESDCCWAYDPRQTVGLFYRVGQYVNRGTGQLQLFAFRKGGKRFKLVTQNAPGPRDRWASGQRVGSFVVESLGDRRMRYRWGEEESEGDVEFYESFYEPRDWLGDDDARSRYDAEVHDGGHLECSGRMRGWVRLGDETTAIEALAHRDRSWGRREVRGMYQHRMCTGTIGPEFSWATVLVQFADAPPVTMGYVVRNGESQQLRGVEFLATIEYDSLSVRSSMTRLAHPSGETIDLDARTEQGFLNAVPGYGFSSDSIATLEHDGKRGFCYFSAGINPARGEWLPTERTVGRICVREGLGDSAP